MKTLSELIAKWTDQADYLANKRFHCENCGVKATAIKEVLADLKELAAEQELAKKAE